jgi:hypothetical protein
MKDAYQITIFSGLRDNQTLNDGCGRNGGGYGQEVYGRNDGAGHPDSLEPGGTGRCIRR